jgi:hypothetical protein
MTAHEWVDIARRINANWPHRQLPKATLAKYFDDLRDLPAQHVAAAVEVLHREGREWPPTAGQVLQKLAELSVDAPEWPFVARRLRRVAAFPANVIRAGRTVDARAERLKAEPPLLQAFVEHVGWQEIAACPEDDRIAEAQLRTKWERFAARQHRDLALTGLPSAGLPALERIARRPGLRQPTQALAELTRPFKGGESA